ncbi:MAG: S-layer homology domain-containing protein [Microthrixaceae bacterium]
MAAVLLLAGLAVTVGTTSTAGALTISSASEGQINKSGDGTGGAGAVGWCNGFLGSGAPVDYRYHLDGWTAVWELSEDGGATWANAPDGSTYGNGDQVRVTFNATSGTAAGNEIFSQTHLFGSEASLTSKLSVQNASVSPLVTSSGTASVSNPGGTIRYVNSFSVMAGPFTMGPNSPSTAVFDITNLEIDSSNASSCNADFDVAAKDLSFTIVREPVNLCLNPPAAGFNDVPLGQYYTLPIDWLVAMGITTGTGAGVYSPTQSVTRAQMATFLWRYAGSPTGNPAHGMGDVVGGSFYEEAVKWLVDQGITQGTAPGVFSPDAAVTRKDMAVFIWRAEGMQEGPPHSFTDVVGGSYYENAVQWLVHAGITSGTSATTYSPNAPVTRRDMAVFLYRRGCLQPA